MVHRVCFSRHLPHASTSSFNLYYRLTAAGADFGLHLLTKSATASEIVFPFGNGLSGHHGRVRWNTCHIIIGRSDTSEQVNDMSFCGGRGEDSHRYVATVSGMASLDIACGGHSEKCQMTRCLWSGIWTPI